MKGRESALAGNGDPHVSYMGAVRCASVGNSGFFALNMEGANCVNVESRRPHVLSMGRFTMTPLYGAERCVQGRF